MVPSSDAHSAPTPSSKSRILIVEDEWLIRMMLSDELRDAGYEVVEASNADEAIAILQTGLPIDLVFSDVRMPGSIDGLGLLAFVRSKFSALPVIMTSGHAVPTLVAASGASQYLAKPYVPDVAVKAIQQVLTKRL